MEKKDLRIVYMGTPEFAVESLRVLVEGGYNIVAVVTMPDKPAGRGHKLQSSPVKQYAEEQGLRLLQPERLKDETFLSELKALHADLQIVVAFRMLPEVVWAMPRYGTFNLHGSLLPQYRGAAPINWAIINGETETGVTTFFLQHEIDTGNIILQERTPIAPEDDLGTIYDRLMKMGAGLVLKTVEAIRSGEVKETPQRETDTLRLAPKIYKTTSRLDFNRNAEDLHNLVRGLSPYPAAWAEVETSNGQRVVMKVYRTSAEKAEPTEPVGTIVSDGKKMLKVACRDGYLHLEEVQMAGKKRMSVRDLLCGFHPEGVRIVTEKVIE